MKYKKSHILIAIAIIAILVFVMKPQPEKATTKKTTSQDDVDRTFQRSYVYQGDTIDVTYTPSAGDWSLDEVLPTGWSVQGVTIYSQRLRDYFSTGSPVVYTFIAPSTIQAYNFDQGTFQLGVADPNWYSFYLDTINVQACPGGTNACDGVDNDCDYQTDESDEQINPDSCSNQNGVCAGSTSIVCMSGAWQACSTPDYEAHNSNYEIDETAVLACDGLDNDCDTQTDENMVNAGSTNTLIAGVCGASPNNDKSCISGAWQDDYSNVANYVVDENAHPTLGTPAQCDALDNDCDGGGDEPKNHLVSDTSGDGDSDCSGCIENVEFTAYKNAWKQVLKQNNQFTELKNKWITLDVTSGGACI